MGNWQKTNLQIQLGLDSDRPLSPLQPYKNLHADTYAMFRNVEALAAIREVVISSLCGLQELKSESLGTNRAKDNNDEEKLKLVPFQLFMTLHYL